VDALLAFGAALLALRLSGDLVRRWRARRRPELAAWAASLAAYALAAGALAWGAAAGWSDAAFRVYYLGGALLTAALLGVGSLLLLGKRRWTTPIALVYTGLAIGVAIAVPLQTDLTGTEIPEAQDVLDVWPARVLAILGNSLGTLAVVVVAVATYRARPRGNALILAGIAVAAIGSGLAGLGIGALAPTIALAAILLYAGFVAPSPLTKPRPHEDGDDGERDRRLDDRTRDAPVPD
jgi:MFS family permease